MARLFGLVTLMALSCAETTIQRGDAELARARERMVATQIAARDVRDARTLAAMQKVPRHLFVPEALTGQAYEDHRTHSDFRRRGFARAVTLECLYRLKAIGIRNAYITGYDHGVIALYGSLGHVDEFKSFIYEAS